MKPGKAQPGPLRDESKSGPHRASRIQRRVVLPTELICLIFDDLASLFRTSTETIQNGMLYTSHELEHKRCFTSCSLVCRHWLGLAKPHLDYHLSIRFTYQDFQGMPNLHELAVWLDSNPSLSTSVRHLRLIMWREDDNAWTMGVINTFGGCDPLHLRKFILKFTKLRVLETVNVWFNVWLLKRMMSTNTVELPLLGKLDRFATIYMEHNRPTTESVQHRLSWLCNVDQVTIQAHAWLTWVTQGRRSLLDVHTVPKALRTSSLTIVTSEPARSLLESLRRSNTFIEKVLRNLHLSIDSTHTLLDLPPLLRAATPSLLQLTLDFKYFTDLEADIMPPGSPLVPINVLSHLRSLTLTYSLPAIIIDTDSYWAIHQSIERQLPSLRRLRMITLVFTDNESCDPNTMDPLIEESRKSVVPTLVTLILAIKGLTLFKRLRITFVNFRGRELEAPDFLRDQVRSLLGPALDDGIVQIV